MLTIVLTLIVIMRAFRTPRLGTRRGERAEVMVRSYEQPLIKCITMRIVVVNIDNAEHFTGDDNDNEYDIDGANDDMRTPRLGTTRGGRAEVMLRATTGRRAGSRNGCNR